MRSNWLRVVWLCKARWVLPPCSCLTSILSCPKKQTLNFSTRQILHQHASPNSVHYTVSHLGTRFFFFFDFFLKLACCRVVAKWRVLTSECVNCSTSHDCLYVKHSLAPNGVMGTRLLPIGRERGVYGGWRGNQMTRTTFSVTTLWRRCDPQVSESYSFILSSPILTRGEWKAKSLYVAY